MERKAGKMDLIYFHEGGSYFKRLVGSRSERICIEHPNLINLSFLFAQISSRASHFRLMYFISK